jgi:hypothetical protein
MIGPDDDEKKIESKNTIYLGTVDRDTLLDAYDACDIFLMPSEYESFGLVFCEAWMRKKPVIGNKKCGPVAELIEHGKDGFLCNSPTEAAEQIKTLIDNPKRAEKMGENGYQKTITKYTWSAVAERVKEELMDIL